MANDHDTKKPGKNAKTHSSTAKSPVKNDTEQTPSIMDAMEKLNDVTSLFLSHDKLRSDYENLSKEHTVLKCQHENLRSEHGKLSSDHSQLYRRVEMLESKIFDLENLLDKTKKDQDHYATEKDNLKQKVEMLENIADDAETAQRSAYLVVSNLPETSSKSDEDIFIELCNSQLGTPISKDDIANVSRIKGNTNNNNSSNNTGRANRPKLMVIKFQNEKARNTVYSNKKKLKGTGKIISEFLTRKKSDLLKRCYDTIPGTFAERSIWTHYGKILVRKAGSTTRTYEIKSDIDIKKFLDAHGMAAQHST